MGNCKDESYHIQSKLEDALSSLNNFTSMPCYDLLILVETRSLDEYSGLNTYISNFTRIFLSFSSLKKDGQKRRIRTFSLKNTLP